MLKPYTIILIMNYYANRKYFIVAKGKDNHSSPVDNGCAHAFLLKTKHNLNEYHNVRNIAYSYNIIQLDVICDIHILLYYIARQKYKCSRFFSIYFPHLTDRSDRKKRIEYP